MEDLTSDARQHVQNAQRPVGIPLNADYTAAEVKETNDTIAAPSTTDIVY